LSGHQLWQGVGDKLDRFLAEKLGCDVRPGFHWMAITNDSGDIIGGVLWSSYKAGQDVTMTIAADVAHHPSMYRLFVPIFDYPFNVLKVPHVSAEIEVDNKASRRLAEWVGFRPYGVKRQTSICLYGLTLDDWTKARAKLLPS
jgi:hypothetical protein